MKVVCWVLVLLLASPTESGPMIRLHQSEASLVLERDVISFGDIPLPTLLRLQKMVEIGNVDLEEMVGGGATKHTQFEKDVHKMVYAWLIRKIADKTVKTMSSENLDGYLKSISTFKCEKCLSIDPEKAQVLTKFISFFPPLLAIGEAIDQFFNLREGCPLSERAANKGDNLEDGEEIKELQKPHIVSAIDLANSAARSFQMTDNIPQLAKKFASLAFEFSDRPLDLTTDEKVAKTQVSVCHLIRPYLKERGFLEEQDLLTPVGTEVLAFSDFKDLVGLDPEYSVPLFAMFDFSRYIRKPFLNPDDIKALYVEQPIDLGGEFITALDRCESQIVRAMVRRSQEMKSSGVWKSEDLFFAVEGSSGLSIYPSFAREDSSSADSGKRKINFVGFERLLKTVDIGSYIYQKGGVFAFEKISQKAEAGTTDSMESMLFDVISKAGSDGITVEQIKEFLLRLCAETEKQPSTDAQGRAQEALRDYDHDGSGNIDRYEFAAALKNYPVLVHGVSDDVLQSIFRDKLSLSEKQWIGFAQSLILFGSLAKYSVDQPQVSYVSGTELLRFIPEGDVKEVNKDGKGRIMFPDFFDALKKRFKPWAKFYDLSEEDADDQQELTAQTSLNGRDNGLTEEQKATLASITEEQKAILAKLNKEQQDAIVSLTEEQKAVLALGADQEFTEEQIAALDSVTEEQNAALTLLTAEEQVGLASLTEEQRTVLTSLTEKQRAAFLGI